MTDATRQRARRARRKRRGAVLPIEVDDLPDLGDLLVELGLLQLWDDRNRAAITVAVSGSSRTGASPSVAPETIGPRHARHVVKIESWYIRDRAALSRR